MGAKRLTERFAYQGGKVNRTGPRPVISGVLLCGPTSANRRRYRKEAFAGEGVKKYEGKPVYVGHPTGRDERTYGEQIGWIRNPRLRADGMPVADIEVKPKHPLAEQFLDDAETHPTAVGMSHVANCQTRPAEDGWEEVMSIESVESVDVVLNPATTTSLFEQKGNTVKISLKQFVERFGPKWGVKKWATATKLVEDFGAPADAPVMDAPPDDAAGDEGDLKTALMAALAPILDDAFESGDSAKACSALKDFIKMHSKHTGTGDVPAVDGDSDDADDDDDDTETEESAKPKLADPWAVLKECREVCGPEFIPGDAMLKALSRTPDEADRKALLAEHKAITSAQYQRPQSGRPTAATKTDETVPTDGKKFAESIR